MRRNVKREGALSSNVQRETTFPQGMSRRQAAPAMPPGAEAKGAENELAQRVPRRGLVVRLTEAGAPLPRRCRSSSPSTSSASGRCLPESRPKAERFTPVS